MKKEDLDRLNELEDKFEKDPEYEELSKLHHEAWSEYGNVKRETSFMGSAGDADYYFRLPFDKLDRDRITGKWTYRHYGFDIEVHKDDGSVSFSVEGVMDREAKYFIDKMLEAREKADPRIPISWLNEQADNPLRSDQFRRACDMIILEWNRRGGQEESE